MTSSFPSMASTHILILTLHPLRVMRNIQESHPHLFPSNIEDRRLMTPRFLTPSSFVGIDATGYYRPNLQLIQEHAPYRIACLWFGLFVAILAIDVGVYLTTETCSLVVDSSKAA